MSPLQNIPPKVRSTLYLLYALAGLVLGACPIIGVEDLWGFAVTKAGALLVYLGVAFGFTAAANVGVARIVKVPVNVNEIPDDPA